MPRLWRKCEKGRRAGEPTANPVGARRAVPARLARMQGQAPMPAQIWAWKVSDTGKNYRVEGEFRTLKTSGTITERDVVYHQYTIYGPDEGLPKTFDVGPDSLGLQDFEYEFGASAFSIDQDIPGSDFTVILNPNSADSDGIRKSDNALLYLVTGIPSADGWSMTLSGRTVLGSSANDGPTITPDMNIQDTLETFIWTWKVSDTGRNYRVEGEFRTLKTSGTITERDVVYHQYTIYGPDEGLPKTFDVGPDSLGLQDFEYEFGASAFSIDQDIPGSDFTVILNPNSADSDGIRKSDNALLYLVTGIPSADGWSMTLSGSTVLGSSANDGPVITRKGAGMPPITTGGSG